MSIPNLNRIIKARENAFIQGNNTTESVTNDDIKIIELIESLFNYIEKSNNNIMNNLDELTKKIESLGDSIK